MDELRAQRMGAVLRRIPGVSLVLEARLAVRHVGARRAARRREQRLVERDRRWIDSLAGCGDLRINVGSSGQHIEGWISADLSRDADGRCLRMDATQRWPFASDAAAAITTEHMIEHIGAEAVPAVLAEAFRVLRPGGVLRISTPDLRGISKAYVRDDAAVLEAHRRLGYRARTYADLVNNYVHEFGHAHVYDFESLRLLLEDAGFVDIREASYGESEYPELRGVDRHDPAPLNQLVLWIDAVKPATEPSASGAR